MASNSDMDVEDYYVIEDANESASSKYVPCVNYTNDNVYPEDVKNGWVRLEQDTGPPNIYRFEASCCNYLHFNNYTPGAVFDEFFEGKMWTILSENTNKYVHAKLRQAKDKGDKDPIELLSEGFSRKILWNSIGVETAFSTHHFLVTTCPEIVFKTSCGIFMSVIQMRPTHQREKQTMILCFWLGQW